MASSRASQNSTPTNTATSHRPSSRLNLEIVPAGTVQRIRNEVEARIANQDQESDAAIIQRAQEHAAALYGTNLSYAERLRVTETLSISNLSPSLVTFLQAHDNMARAIRRTERIASRAEQTPGIDVLTHVAIRILHLRNVFYYFHITTAADTNIPSALRLVGDIDADIESLRDLIIDDYVQTLIHHEILSGEHLQDHELENVGPDHDVNSLGQEVEASRSRNEDHVHIHLEHYKLKNVGSDHDIKSPGQEVEDRKLQNENEEGVTVEPRAGYLPTPPSSSHTYAEDTYVHTPMDKTNEYDEDDDDDDTDEYDDDEYDEDEYDNDKPSCSICSEPYSGSHRAFRITVCGHIFGKECISKWVNSTACNANLCPECRTSLCTRRPRRPVPDLINEAEPQSISAQMSIQGRLLRTKGLLEQLADIYSWLWDHHSSWDLFFDACMALLNFRFFVHDLRWRLANEDDDWVLQRVLWHH